ncbi:UDP-N-acetylmuramoyl-tripeptide--D-alanyl-D-alanine ligase [Terriglobus aquaticus]|uniref:UDP-N-acetylmuramoyl-tripeptide--D-alanyl-D-alanine ligase n=1 Tax=Terriglobus aquaticus TaxID=940139 RepID=A0ABW9KHN0_9BACT|nr:UDP-N-acetylmuramoyl-tripeptide--D-alanyl-D-alanine ligase [Terriglobus aquaticus]
MKLTLGQIGDILHAEGDYNTATAAYGYSIDTRTLAAGDLYFAVTGERLDGHDFVEAALEKGAAAAVISTRWVVPDTVDPTKLLRVPDSEDCVLRAMQTLARAVRRMWSAHPLATGEPRRVIGITGSAGKTTTKECVAAVLSARFHVLKSAGNLNNGFGLPLQLLKLEPEHEVAVLEMGMNHAGEITALARIAEPDWAVVSNVAPVHLEHFADGIQGIANAKYELVQALPPEGVPFLNADDTHVRTFSRNREQHTVFFGVEHEAPIRATDVQNLGADGMQFTALAYGETMPAHIALLGEHNVLNALAAIAVGRKAGIPLERCVEALSALTPADKRGELLHWHGAKIINDCYNSNPRALDSMSTALMAVRADRRIVVAGEMLELGPEAAHLHRCCGQHMRRIGIDRLIAVRGEAIHIAEGFGEGAIFVDTPEQAGEWLHNNLHTGDAVLLKASRGVRLERALSALTPE